MKFLAIFAFLPFTLFAKEDRLILLGASYGKNVLAICEPDGTVIWKHETGGPKNGGHTGHHDVQLLENGNILFHDSWSVTSEIAPAKEIVWKHDSKGANVHAFQRLDNGHTMIAESGLGRIVHVDKKGEIKKEVPLPKNGRHETRMVEILPNGHYLSCAENPGVVTEYDSNGKIVWEYETNTRVFGAIRLKNGNTLIASGSGNSILEVSPDKIVVWEIAKKIPGTDIELAWTTDLQELPNGNIVIGNCHAGDDDPQIVELDKDRKVVWTFDEYELVGNGLACWEILDPKQTAFVRSIIKKKAVKTDTTSLLEAKRILFLGDSITAARHYIVDLQAALDLHGHTPEVIALGLGSEGVTGLSEPPHPFPRPDVTERLDRALSKVQPDLVFACYGMNDGIYHPFSDERFIKYQKGIHSLIDKVNASGANLILLTPPPFDPEAPRAKETLVGADAEVFAWTTIYENYDAEVIARYAKFILSLAPRVQGVIDLHTPINQHMKEQRKANSDFTLSGDGVHLNREGLRLMADVIHQALLKKPLPDLPADLVKFHQTRQSILAPAWLTHTGHTRPGIKAGLPLAEAKAKAAAIKR